MCFYSKATRIILFLHQILFCRMVARYAPPISYNFLNLIRLGGNAKTTFEKVIVVFFFLFFIVCGITISVLYMSMPYYLSPGREWFLASLFDF
jgi:hypothetical protein